LKISYQPPILDDGMRDQECAIGLWVLGQNGTGKIVLDKMVYGQKRIGQNGMDNMVQTKWH